MIIIVKEDDWNDVRSLVFNEKGMYHKEINQVFTGWMSPFRINVKDYALETFKSLLDETGIQYNLEDKCW